MIKPVWIIVLSILGLMFLIGMIVGKNFDRKCDAIRESLDITPNRREKAQKLMTTAFFKKVYQTLIEKIRRYGPPSSKQLVRNNVYVFVYGNRFRSIYSYIGDGDEQIRDFGDYEIGSDVYYSNLGYRDISNEDALILAIALSLTGYFDCQIDYDKKILRLKLKKKIKTNKEIEEEKRLNNLKDIWSDADRTASSGKRTVPPHSAVQSDVRSFSVEKKKKTCYYCGTEYSQDKVCCPLCGQKST